MALRIWIVGATATVNRQSQSPWCYVCSSSKVNYRYIILEDQSVVGGLMRMLDNILRFEEHSMTSKFKMIEDRKLEIELIL